MTEVINNFRPDFSSAKPVRIVPLGSIHALYIPRLVAISFLFNRKVVYPSIVEFRGKLSIAFFFDRPPKEYSEKSYKIYRLKRNEKICFYLPVPKQISPLFGNLKKSLLNYHIGMDSNKNFILVLERVE